jgi:hypothetical protein
MTDHDDLRALFAKYGTDKLELAHVYHALLYFRRHEIRSVLEIGIGAMCSMRGYAAPHYLPGGSLRAWRDWLPNASVLGLDIRDETLFREDRISTDVCDSTDAVSVRRVLADQTFDLIIDDGAHEWEAQLKTLTNCYPHLRADGLYVIEDIYRASPLVRERHWIYDVTGHQECLFVGREDPIAVIFAHPLRVAP